MQDWFVAERMLGPLGIVSLGSDTIDGYVDAAAGQMQGARFESGLDNSPMWDSPLTLDNHIAPMSICISALRSQC